MTWSNWVAFYGGLVWPFVAPTISIIVTPIAYKLLLKNQAGLAWAGYDFDGFFAFIMSKIYEIYYIYIDPFADKSKATIKLPSQ